MDLEPHKTLKIGFFSKNNPKTKKDVRYGTKHKSMSQRTPSQSSQLPYTQTLKNG